MLKRTFFITVCICGWAPLALAQVELDLRIEPSRAVLYEPVVARLRIQNNTGQPLVVGDSESGGRLWFDIERAPGRFMRQTSPSILSEPLTVPPRSHVVRRIELTRAYDLRDTGPYTIQVGIDWNGRAYASGKEFLDVVPALELMRTTGAVSSDGGGTRLYRLMTLNRDRGEHLFLRIDDEAAGICYSLVHLGRILRVQPPSLQVDAHNQIAILHQAGPGRYFYHLFGPNGDRIERRVYTSEDRGVSLVEGAQGRYVVSGASSSMSDSD